MYLSPLKGMLTQAIKETFDVSYPNPAFRDVHCSIEYPVEPQDYPGIWVDYDDTKPLQTAGVDHHEDVVVQPVGMTPGSTSRFLRWKFAGYVSYTVVALTSLERDDLAGELVRVLAFGRQAAATARFRQYIEDNELIACNFDFDQVEMRGNAAVPGTPWGTDEIVYERTLNMEVVGEFISDSITGLLVPLSRIQIDDPVLVLPGETPPAPSGEGWV